MATIRTDGDEIPAGMARVSLVTDDATGGVFFQEARADGSFYLCDADGEEIGLHSWTLQRHLADIPAGDSDAFFEAVWDAVRVDEARRLYPDAPLPQLCRIAWQAQALAESTEREGRAEDWSYSAAQGAYGVDWEWGTGTVTRDEYGAIVPEEDETPKARVYDCDGETIRVLGSDTAS